MKDAFQFFQVTADELKIARYSGSPTASLYDMVQNLRAVSIVLYKLGLDTYQADCDARSSRQFPSGFTLAASDVIERLGWALKTYTKKASGYVWAEKASKTKCWKSTVPG